MVADVRPRPQRRERFFAEVVDPLIDKARVIGIPLEDVVARIQQAPAASARASRPATGSAAAAPATTSGQAPAGPVSEGEAR